MRVYYMPKPISSETCSFIPDSHCYKWKMATLKTTALIQPLQ